MRFLSHVETLLFYDGPELFVGRDQLGTSYVCVLVELNEETDKYLCVPVSPSRLNHLRTGDLDLREMVEHAETGEAFEGRVEKGDLSKIQIRPFPEIPETWLPKAGFYVEELDGIDDSKN